MIRKNSVLRRPFYRAQWAVLCLLSLLAAVPTHADCVLRQSDAVELPLGQFVDATDGVTAETGLTISQADVQLKKCAAAGDCGAMAQKSDTSACAHDALGVYECDLNATDTDTVGTLFIYVNESGALTERAVCQVVEEAVFDACCAGSSAPLTAAGVWSNGTRSLTELDEDNTTIDINGTATGAAASVAGTVNGLTATAQGNVRDALGMSAANLDTQLSGLDTLLDTIAAYIDTEIQTLLNGVDIESINDVAITGDGSGTPFTVSP